MSTEKFDPVSTVPEQFTGTQKNFEEIVEVRDSIAASELFEQSKRRLLDINNWNEIGGSFSARFRVTDEKGNEINRNVKTGDCIKINVPAPGPEDGADWVRIEAIEESSDADGMKRSIAMRVRPTHNPENPDNNVEHFFSADTTSNFIVQRVNNQVMAGIYGRNEKPNLETSDLPEKIRNTIVALGAILGFAEVQWRNLLLGILGKK